MEMEIGLTQSGYPTPRRRWARYKVDVPLTVVTRRRGEIITIEGCGSELNGGGMTVTLTPLNATPSLAGGSAAIDLCICEHVTVAFTPPHSRQTIRLRCVVRNRRRQTYGLEFRAQRETGHDGLDLIDSILHDLSPY